MTMKIKHTNRGFGYYEFKDSYGEKCSLQKSSKVGDYIWLGTNPEKMTVFRDSTFGKYDTVDIPENYQIPTRMHLSRKQVLTLLPILTAFVESGEI